MKNLFEKLKKKWGVDGSRFILICIAFSAAGMSVVFIKPFIFDLLLPETSSEFLKWVVYILTLFPAYQILLLGYGFLLGQFNFFWEKQKRLLSIISSFFNIPRNYFNKKSSPDNRKNDY